MFFNARSTTIPQGTVRGAKKLLSVGTQRTDLPTFQAISKFVSNADTPSRPFRHHAVVHLSVDPASSITVSRHPVPIKLDIMVVTASVGFGFGDNPAGVFAVDNLERGACMSTIQGPDLH